jgi:D-alanyl-D-alanine carboxypeptidase
MSLRLSSTLAILFLFTFSASYAATMPTPAAPIIGAKSYLVIDSKTGHEIAALVQCLEARPDHAG